MIQETGGGSTMIILKNQRFYYDAALKTISHHQEYWLETPFFTFKHPVFSWTGYKIPDMALQAPWHECAENRTWASYGRLQLIQC